MSRVSRVLLTSVLTFWALLLFPNIADAQTDSAELRRAKQLIEKEKVAILLFAHPTADFQSIQLEAHKAQRNGFSLVYKFYWYSPISEKKHTTQLTFHFDDNGNLDFIQTGHTSSLFKPFFGSNTVGSLIKSELKKDASLQNDREFMKLLEMNAKEILESYLRRDVSKLATVVAVLLDVETTESPSSVLRTTPSESSGAKK